MIPYEIFENGNEILVKTTREFIYAVEQILIEKGYWVMRVIYTCEGDLIFIQMFKGVLRDE